jgi:phage terminase Nu1 subunit (DNA packaging protein)
MAELTTRELAERWGVSAQTVRAYVRQGMPRTSERAAAAWRSRHHPDPEHGRRNGGRKPGAGRPRSSEPDAAKPEREPARQDRKTGPLPTDASAIMRLAQQGRLTLHELSIVQQALRATQHSVELEVQMGKLVEAEEVRSVWVETLAAFRIELSGIGPKAAATAVAELGLSPARQQQLASLVGSMITRALEAVVRRSGGGA